MNTISHYNDRCRKALLDYQELLKLKSEGCQLKIVKTASFNTVFDDDEQAEIFKLLASFNKFNEDNDPYQEHDFIRVSFNDEWIIAKFDYYAPDLEHGSEDAQDLSKTVRVLTIMLSMDY